MLRSTLALARPVALLVATLGLTSLSAQAHVNLTAPDGGEVLAAGSTIQIEWTVAIEHNLLNWDLWYSIEGPNGPWTVIEEDIAPGDGTAGAQHAYDWLVPDAPSTRVRVRVRQDNSGGDYDDVSDGDFTITSSCTAPVSYCATSPNSVGAGATISHIGSIGIATNDLEVQVNDAPAGQLGLFYYGSGQVQVPFGNGLRCVSGTVVRLGPPVQVNLNGNKKRALDFTQAPLNSGPGAITPGSTWNFQFWYRDPAAGGSSFNLSDGLSVTFCP